MTEPDWLEKLIAHEAAYFQFAAEIEKTPTGWFLTNPEIAEYRDANHALRLRDDGRGPDAVAQSVISYYRSHGLPPVADTDEVAEAQGIGSALRRRGVLPVIGNTLLMRYSPTPPEQSRETVLPPPDTRHPTPVSISVVPNETGAGEATAWIETVLAGGFSEDSAFWQKVIEREARFPACRLYLADWDGQNAGACNLFEANGWAKVESVGTRPEFRRRGVASALVRRAIADSQANGASVLYLFTEAGGDGEQVYRNLGFVPWKLNPFRRHRES